MLKIKLARFGKRNQPHYRIVVNEARTKRDGEYIDLLGHYAPTQTPKVLKIDMKLYKEWIEKGAQPTDTVASLARRFESGNPFPEKPKKLSKKALAKKEAQKAEAAKPKEEVVEAPAEAEAPVETEAPSEEAPSEAPAEEAPAEEKSVEETAETPEVEKPAEAEEEAPAKKEETTEK